MDISTDGYAKHPAAIVTAAVVAAMAPDATVDSVVDQALAAAATHRVEGELTRQWDWYDHVFRLNERLVGTALEIAAGSRDVFEVREAYYAQL